MIECEGCVEYRNLSPQSTEEYEKTRLAVFLNLAAANLKLGGADGAKKCCNAALMFCNNSSMLLDDIGDTSEDIYAAEPVSPSMLQFVTKALYRRGMCHLELGNVQKAYSDFQAADRFSPNDKSILHALKSAENKLNSVANTFDRGKAHCEAPETRIIVDSPPVINGGMCLLRQGFWSQSIDDVTVYLPISTLLNLLLLEATLKTRRTTDIPKETKAKAWRIEFSADCISFSHPLLALDSVGPPVAPVETLQLQLQLQHSIQAAECTWTLTALNVNSATVTASTASSAPTSTSTLTSTSTSATTATGSNHITLAESEFIVLHLIKQSNESGTTQDAGIVNSNPNSSYSGPSIVGGTGKDDGKYSGNGVGSGNQSNEWHPGCEWWDRCVKFI
jgi:hypothetical protein